MNKEITCSNPDCTDYEKGRAEGRAEALAEVEKILGKNIKQLKADLGILPYSDVEQPEKFGEMSMQMAEDNINDFFEATKSEFKELQSPAGVDTTKNVSERVENTQSGLRNHPDANNHKCKEVHK